MLAPVVIVACAAPGAGDTPSPPASPGATPSASLPPLDPGPVPADLFGQILQDAVSRGANMATLTVVQAASVTWNDGSLGCPEPGMFYTQALVDGYQVILEDAGSQYDYHASQNSFVLCPADRANPPIGDDI